MGDYNDGWESTCPSCGRTGTRKEVAWVQTDQGRMCLDCWKEKKKEES